MSTAKAGHLRQVDLVRVLTFAAVIAVHSVAAAFAPESIPGNALLSFLHFTREGFFALSGFVLVHSARGRPFRPVAFWRKRLPLVALPYLAWSALYLLLHAALGTAPLPAPRQVVSVLLDGSAEYHLYFLLVTLQIYLALPALLWLLHRTRGYHPLLLTGSLLLQLGTSMFLQYGTPHTGAGRFYAAHGYELLPSYQFWVLLGALAAVHLERVSSVVERFAHPLVAGAIGVLVAGQIGYLLLVRSGTSPSVAASVFSPMLVPLFATTIVLLYVVGTRWAAKTTAATRTSMLVTAASEASFGIYLVHPAVLDVLAGHLSGLMPPLAAGLLWVAAVAVSVLVVAAVRRTPVSLALSGRPRRRPGITSTPVPAGAAA